MSSRFFASITTVWSLASACRNTHDYARRAASRLPPPASRLPLPDPFPGVRGEEVRSLEVEREDDPGTEWRQRLRRNAGRDVMTSSARVDECLVAERLYEIESRCRGSRSGTRACDY